MMLKIKELVMEYLTHSIEKKRDAKYQKLPNPKHRIGQRMIDTGEFIKNFLEYKIKEYELVVFGSKKRHSKSKKATMTDILSGEFERGYDYIGLNDELQDGIIEIVSYDMDKYLEEYCRYPKDVTVKQ